MADIPKSGFKITRLDLVECSFHRTLEVNYEEGPDGKKESNNFNLNVDPVVQGNSVSCTLTLKYGSFYGDTRQIEAVVSYRGQFEFFGELPIKPEEFSRVNAAGIIFPFVKEQLANLCMKAGVRIVWLPPVNFVEMARLTDEQAKKNAPPSVE